MSAGRPLAGGAVRIEDARVRLGHTLVLDRLALEIAAGECLALLGHSGSGRTTILRLLAGFVQPEQGTVTLDNRDITYEAPEHRGMAMIHQRFLLFPHLTVAENVAFGLPYHGFHRVEHKARVAELLTLVGLDNLARRYPNQLSGGQQQRVAIARALAIEPRVLLLDEPLNSLDSTIRERLLDELRSLHQASGMTMLYVTHDQAEAAYIADQVALLEDGRILQIGPFEALRDRPASASVARQLGLRNLLPVEVQDGYLVFPTLDLRLPWPRSLRPGDVPPAPTPPGPLLACLPPDRFLLGTGRPDWLAFDGIVEEIMMLAHGVTVRIRRGHGVVEARVSRGALDASDLAVGGEVQVSLAPEALHLLPSDTAS